jgi:DNA invertase Pin-like site-specific DNA recombinase
MTPKPKVHCAIYTRKSTDEGLDQDFNSLDAQYEACTAYIASQRHEGWKLKPDRYDDGGISGGTLERPGLKRLLADIDAGRVGMIVVYKIDRLTRSLADFAKLIERLDASGCSFVSVTQAFNTSSSMGRLTLNVLLSFAQFEREVTAERIRDKIAASKKKGLWMGGTVPLGYDCHPDPQTRELVINPKEAKVVQQLFGLYDELGCLGLVEESAAKLGLKSKHHVFSTGRTRGGGPFTRGQIHYLLTNPVYLGKIRHKEKIWPGLHGAVIAEDLWDRVQIKLQAASARRRGQTMKKSPGGQIASASILTGKFRDGTGDRLTPSHTRRHGRQLRYYVSNRLISGGKDPTGWRLPAPAFELAVTNIIISHIEDCAHGHLIMNVPEAIGAEQIKTRALGLTDRCRTGDPNAIGAIIGSGKIGQGKIQIALDGNALSERLSIPLADFSPTFLSIAQPFGLRRRGVEARIVAGEQQPAPDATLIRVLAKAHRWVAEIRAGKSLSEIARDDGHADSYVRVRAQLAFLSPKIQQAILDGRQPPELSLERIVRTKNIPLDWSQQERMFGL